MNTFLFVKFDMKKKDYKSTCSLCIYFRLVEYEMKKKDYVTHIKCYMKRVKAMLEEKKPEEVEKFTKNANAFVKSQLGEFKEWQFFCGEYCRHFTIFN